MTGKTFLYAAVVLSFVVGGPVGYIIGHASSPADVSPAVPDDSGVIARTVDVGELVVFEPSGERTSWVIIPETPSLVLEGKLVVSFRTAGPVIVFDASIIEGNVVVNRHDLIVKTPGPAPLSPTNSVWSDILARTVPPKVDAAALAKSFRDVASSVQSQIDAGVLVTHDDLIKYTAESNRKAVAANTAAWAATFAAISTELEKSAAGKSMKDHVSIWIEIANALESYSR